MQDFFRFLSTAVVMGAFTALAVEYGWAISLFGLFFALYMYRTNATDEEDDE